MGLRIDAAPDAIVGEQAEDPSMEHTETTTLKTTLKIILIMKSNPSVSASQIASEIGLSVEAVKWNIKRLKAQGRIRRVGPDKGGHWEVVEATTGPFGSDPNGTGD